MQIRKIKESEIIQVCKASAVSFDYPFNKQGKTEEQLIKDILEKPDLKAMKYWQDTWGAFDEDSQLISCLNVIPYTLQFDGNRVKATGIGNVCTYPQHRRKGGVRAIFEESLKDMYKEDVVFSYLYPFSESFYRKFGYEKAVHTLLWDFDLAFIPPYRYKGSFYLCDQGEILPVFEKVYEEFAARHNLMVHRDSFDWDALKNAKGAYNNTYAFLYRDENKQPRGYVIFKKDVEDHKAYLKCQELIFDSFETLKAIFSFLSTYAADYKFFRANLPAIYNLRYFCKDYPLSESKTGYIDNGMVRAVNVEKILGLAAYRGDGQLILKITDDQISQNNDVFKICFEKGKAVRVDREHNADPDIEMPVTIFGAAVTGGYKTQDLLWTDQVFVHHGIEKVSGLFYEKPSWIVNYF